MGIVAYSGYAASAKKNVVKSTHTTIEKWFNLKAMVCEIEGKVTYHDWQNRGTTKQQNCNYNNGWNLVMDLGYNHFRYHFLAEYQYNNNFKNPYDPNSQWENPSWNNGCSNTVGATTFYGQNTGAFLIWTNIGTGTCLSPTVQFPL